MTNRTKLILFVAIFVLAPGLAGAAGVCIYQQHGAGWYVAFVIAIAWLGVPAAMLRRRRVKRGDFKKDDPPPQADH